MTENSITLAGYLGKDAALRTLPSGSPVTTFRLGQTRHYTDGRGQHRTKTNWFTVVTYGPVAERAAAYRKGDNVVLQGELEYRQWEGDDGSKRSVTEVIGLNIARVEAASAPAEADAALSADDSPVLDADHDDANPVLRRDR